MALLDNVSRIRPILMYSTVDLSTAATLISLTFDTKDFDAGYLIMVSSNSIGVSTTFNVDIQTSSTVGGGFVTVPASQLIGGAFPQFGTEGQNDPATGTVVASRGILNQTRYVRTIIQNVVSAVGVGVFINLIGNVEVMPSTIPEFTPVNVV